MSNIEFQANWVVPPVSGQVLVAAATSTAASLDISAFSAGNCFITVQADGAKLYVLFGADASVDDALSESATSGAGRCILIPADDERSFRVDSDGPFFIAFKTSGSDTGYIRVYRSSPPGHGYFTDT